MVRSATALSAVLILSGFAWYQQVLTHTVVRGDTLWDLAGTYYQNPWDWRRIFEANRDKIRDPNLIYPDQVFVIPGREAAVTGVEVEPAEPAAEPAPAEPQQAAPRRIGRTVFYQDTTATGTGVMRGGTMDHIAVSRDMVYSAPWLVRLEEEPAHTGRLTEYAGGANTTATPRGYDRVRLQLDDASVQVGDRVLTYRVVRTIEKVGRVVAPTGVITLTELEDGGAVGVITKEYHRMQFGDYVGPLPTYSLTAGQYAQAVSDGPHAMIMGFAGENVVQDVESVAFLDLGTDDGLAVGDEFDYVNPQAGDGIIEGRLQVVGVREGVASARIVHMDDVVFRQGLVVRLARKMP